VQNVEWRHLHEKGSLVTYIHHDEQLRVDESNDKSDAKRDSSGFSEDEMEKTQTEELKKHKAWGSLRTPTKEASLTCPLKKKKENLKQTTVNLTCSLDLTGVLEMDDMEYKQHDLDGSLDISDDKTKQPIGTKANTQDVTIIDGANS
jgi:hypothetical protein